jgi:hypothetical protein
MAIRRSCALPAYMVIISATINNMGISHRLNLLTL